MIDVAEPARRALTGRRVKTIFAVMRLGNPLKLLLQVLSLAAMSLALSIGSAFAHGDHHQATAHSATTYADHRTGEIADVAPGVAVIHARGDARESAPCHDESSGHATGQGCCTIACHAALAAPAIDPVGAVDLPGTRSAGLVDRLEGRPSGRTERPPKRS